MTETKSHLLSHTTTCEELKACAASGNLLAIVDSCDEASVPPMITDLGDRAVSLYKGQAERDYWAIAPYLCRVDALLADWIAQHLLGKPWGFFLIANTDLKELRKHFRRFLMIKNSTGKQVYFRFYDPRVLDAFLSSSNKSEIETFFGPIQRIGLNTNPDNLHWLEAKT